VCCLEFIFKSLAIFNICQHLIEQRQFVDGMDVTLRMRPMFLSEIGTPLQWPRSTTAHRVVEPVGVVGVGIKDPSRACTRPVLRVRSRAQQRDAGGCRVVVRMGSGGQTPPALGGGHIGAVQHVGTGRGGQ
jgi:hypothetical protein